jgi:hypothetical protein
MNAIQFVSDENGNLTSVMVPIKWWRKLTADSEDDDNEPPTLTLSTRDRDLFLAILESPPAPNAELKALMSSHNN